MKVKPVVAWYDMWVGAFWDADKRRLYILPVPCLGVCIEFPRKEGTCIHCGVTMRGRVEFQVEAGTVCGMCIWRYDRREILGGTRIIGR